MFTEYVAASSIWASAKDEVDLGYKQGIVRGYNIEVRDNRTGATSWWSCEYTPATTPEQCFGDEFHTWMYQDHNVTPTGRICFRGYGIVHYDYDGEWVERLEE